MNVFEDLIIELKEEKLLENTVIDGPNTASADDFELDVTGVPNRMDVESVEVERASDPQPKSMSSTGELSAPAIPAEPEAAPASAAPGKNKEFFKKRAVAETSSLHMVDHVLSGVEREYLKIVPRTFDDFKAKKAPNNFIHVSDTEDAGQHATAEFELMQHGFELFPGNTGLGHGLEHAHDQ